VYFVPFVVNPVVSTTMLTDSWNSLSMRSDVGIPIAYHSCWNRSNRETDEIHERGSAVCGDQGFFSIPESMIQYKISTTEHADHTEKEKGNQAQHH
jgi:hypothetical protein